MTRPTFYGNEITTFSRHGHPDRTYRVYTPSGYNTSSPSKVVLALHGWCGDGSDWTLDEDVRRAADAFNYVVVAPDGLGDNEGMCNSWSIKGSTDGLGLQVTANEDTVSSGRAATCDTSQASPDNCYPSCSAASICQNRCSWTHCQDDDVQFVYDILDAHASGSINSLSDFVCFDPSQVFVMGASNGGMMTWELVQDNRTSALFAAAAPMIGLPHCDYNLPGNVPAISLMSKDDQTVSPSNLPYPGNPADVCITNRDGEGYKYVSSHRITSTFAQAGGCRVQDRAFPSLEWEAGTDQVKCKTWCPGDSPFSVDCAFTAGHWTPDYVYEAAFRFFERHS
ncbi:expressed unknown protein [Seminavis robusta]|uniref:Feruloyl esterase n=1 Tax=Seminavis robusta TaxID=568900 RepID=A0A9N8E6M1_9STRA|nr:expressed unknown protein [Seminavis robusta]|eukprot:Sro677_g185790.1 n/a (338) ;mRNA; f:12226-13239